VVPLAIFMMGAPSLLHAQDDLPPIVESVPYEKPAVVKILPPPQGAPSVSPQPAGVASAPVKKRKLSMEARVTRLEHIVEGQALTNLLMRMDGLQQDIQDLRGVSEVQSHQIKGIKQRQRELYLDVDRRLRQVEKAVRTAPPTPPHAISGGQTPALSATVPAAPAAQGASEAPAAATQAAPAAGGERDVLAEQLAYQKVFDVLKEGRYDDAIGAFKQFLQRYPNGQFADNAQYWMAEANYVLRRFSNAIEAFDQVRKRYPDSSKIPDAMLKMGYSYYELKKWQEARNILQELARRYPDSTAAKLAKNRLHRMKLEGR